MPYYVERLGRKSQKWYQVSEHKTEYHAQQWKYANRSPQYKLRVIHHAIKCFHCGEPSTTGRPLNWINICTSCQSVLREDYRHAYAGCNCVRCKRKNYHLEVARC